MQWIRNATRLTLRSALTIKIMTRRRSLAKWLRRSEPIKTCFQIRGGQLYEQFARPIWHTERSIYNTFTISKLLLSEHVHKAGFRVVLTGEGSDELFAGYPQLRLDMIRHGMKDATPAERTDLEAWKQAIASFKAICWLPIRSMILPWLM